MTQRRQQRGGLTAREFCRGEGLAETAYYYWRRELARRDREPGSHAERQHLKALAANKAGQKRPFASSPWFQELSIPGGAAPGVDRCLELILPGGCRVRVPAEADRALLADVLSLLEAQRC